MPAPRITLAALALVVFISGCGQAKSERALLATYITSVNRIESSFAGPLATVSRAGAQFVDGRPVRPSSRTKEQEQALVRGGRQMREQARELSAISVPRPAEHLRALLLELATGQLHLTHELAQLVAFLPSFDATVSPVGPATARLERVLLEQQGLGSAGVAAVFAAKAAALRQFRASIDAIVPELRRLTPPAVSKPGYETELTALEGMSASAGRLASALAGGAKADASRSVREFDRAAVSADTANARRAQVSAARAYERQRAQLATLAREIGREESRLANTVR